MEVEYLIDTETIYDTMVENDVTKFMREVEGPYYMYGPDDDLFTGFELGRELAKDGYDFDTISELVTEDMIRGFKSYE